MEGGRDFCPDRVSPLWTVKSSVLWLQRELGNSTRSQLFPRCCAADAYVPTGKCLLLGACGLGQEGHPCQESFSSAWTVDSGKCWRSPLCKMGNYPHLTKLL